jgi:hypothetical protein
MTEHSTEELKRQYDAALSRVSAASGAAREAREHYYAALIRDKLADFADVGGIVGVTRVREPGGWMGRGDANMNRGPYVVIGADVVHGAVRYVLAKIKKDGAPSNAPSGVNTENVFIIAEDQPK